MGAGDATADAPIVHPPFYAVKVVPGSLGTFVGLRTDPDARVLDTQGVAIPGLYACGADMASIMGGRYPSGGHTRPRDDVRLHRREPHGGVPTPKR